MLVADMFSVTHQQYLLKVPDQAVWIQGDLDAVGICVLNLLENALRHSTPANCISITLASSGQLEIENDCQAIPADQLGRITQRHVRCSNDATGCGLGLSIVTAILDQMGGALAITSPSRMDNRGFKVVVRFTVPTGTGC
jgi:two-component system OmpR family sensor kinase